MRQTRRQSLFETCVSTAVGYAVAVLTQLAVFPLFGLEVAFHDNLIIGLIFTTVSIARGYAVRRFFNYWHNRHGLN